MKVVILGKEHVPYTDRQTGEAKVSKRIHVKEVLGAPVSGLEGDRVYTIKANSPNVDISSLKIGGTYIISVDTTSFNGEKRRSLSSYDEVKA